MMSLSSRSRWFSILGVVSALALVVTMTSTVAADEGQASVDEMSAEEIAERVQAFYSETEDFQASFVQEYTDIAAAETSRSRGQVYFKKPGMMRWDYMQSGDETNQRDRMLVSDGDSFWIYEYEYQQVFQECLEDSQLPTSLNFLMGEGNLLEDFDVELTDDSTAQAPELELTPKEPTSDYQKLEFVLDPETFEVSKTTVFDPYGNTNEINFQNSQVNQNLSASGFEFEVPEGARLLNPEQQCD